jgi:hypothetical protein
VQNIAGRVEMTLLNNSDTDICIAHLGSLSLWLRHRTSPSVRSFRDHRSCLAGKGTVAVHALSLAPHGTRTLTAAVDLLTEQDHPAPALAEYDVVFRAIRTAGNPALSRDAAGRLVYKTCIEAMESPGSEDPPELWTGAVDLGRSPLVLHPPDDTETTQADWE